MNNCTANAWCTWATERSHPMRTCAAAGPFSTRRFATTYGMSVNPIPVWPTPYVAPGSNSESMGGKAVRCSHAVGLPLAPTAAFMCAADGPWKKSNRMSSSRVQTIFTGLPTCRESSAASTT